MNISSQGGIYRHFCKNLAALSGPWTSASIPLAVLLGVSHSSSTVCRLPSLHSAAHQWLDISPEVILMGLARWQIWGQRINQVHTVTASLKRIWRPLYPSTGGGLGGCWSWLI
jgi:hypothetical protein